MRSEFVILLLAASGALLLLDQYSKKLVQVHLSNRCLSCGPVLRIRRVIHRRDTPERHGTRVILVTVWLAALLSSVLLYCSGSWFQSHAAVFGLALALAGAAGNLLDILRWRYVIDFIDLGWWPVFNLADIGIVAGLALAFWPGA